MKYVIHVLPLQAIHHNLCYQHTRLQWKLDSHLPTPCYFPRTNPCSWFCSSRLNLPFLNPETFQTSSWISTNSQLYRIGLIWQLLQMWSANCVFNDTIIKLYDNHTPIRRVELKRTPWRTMGIKATDVQTYCIKIFNKLFIFNL